MSVSMTNVSQPVGTGVALLSDAMPKAREALKPLAKALRAGDLPAAKTAYAQIVKNAPEGATLQPGSPFAAMGKALLGGDIDAAKTAFGEMVRNAVMKPPSISLPPLPSPVASTTGGTAGSLLNAVA